MKKTRADAAYLREVGKRIRSARDAMKWSQEVLAEYAGIDSTTVSKAERGAGNPRLLTIIKIARALDKSCTDFFPAGESAR